MNLMQNSEDSFDELDKDEPRSVRNREKINHFTKSNT